MTYSENQVRHLYVLDGSDITDTTNFKPKSVSALTAAPMDFALAKTKDGECVYLQYNGAGGVTRSDLIPIKNILYAHKTAAAEMAKKLKTATIAVTATSTDGDENTTVDKGTYIVRIVVYNYVGMSDEDKYYRYGQVTSNGNLSVEDFYAKMADSLTKNLSREVGKLFDVDLVEEDSAPVGIKITEVEQDWVLGTKQRVPVLFDVQLVSNDDIFDPSVDGNVTTYDWGTVTVGAADETLNNGKDIADLEYFLMGERADIYRGKGWPNVIPTKYLVDSTSAYDVLDIHFAYVGANECVQKSEKTITLVSKVADLIDTLATNFTSATGVAVTAKE